VKVLFDLEIVIRLANSFVTVGLGILLAYMYVVKRLRFVSLSLWSVAFVLYGFQILLRVWYPWSSIEVFILSSIMSLPLVLGTSSLIRQNRIYGTIWLIGAAVSIFNFFSGSWIQFAALAFYGVMTIAVIHSRLIIGNVANRFIIGWAALLVANVVLVTIFSVEWLADLIAIPAKCILALGMLDQRFARMVLDIKKLYESPSTGRQ